MAECCLWKSRLGFGEDDQLLRFDFQKLNTQISEHHETRTSKLFDVWLVDWLVDFYGVSTLVGYLMPNPVYVVLNIFDL